MKRFVAHLTARFFAQLLFMNTHAYALVHTRAHNVRSLYFLLYQLPAIREG